MEYLKKYRIVLYMMTIVICVSFIPANKLPDPSNYLAAIKAEMEVKWPDNRTINLVFHGHSVPAGYYLTPVVKPFDSYPLMVMKELKKKYPHAVINSINTSIGGENSLSGSKRFKTEVLTHNPDVLFIDYSLNDRRIGLEAAKKYWTKMIKKAIRKNIKVILLTPSPDTRVDILEPNNILEQHANQVKYLADEYQLGLIDSYMLFKNKVIEGDSLSYYMSQSVVHPNERGHQLIVEEIMKYF